MKEGHGEIVIVGGGGHDDHNDDEGDDDDVTYELSAWYEPLQ